MLLMLDSQWLPKSGVTNFDSHLNSCLHIVFKIFQQCLMYWLHCCCMVTSTLQNVPARSFIWGCLLRCLVLLPHSFGHAFI